LLFCSAGVGVGDGGAVNGFQLLDAFLTSESVAGNQPFLANTPMVMSSAKERAQKHMRKRFRLFESEKKRGNIEISSYEGL